LLAGAIINPRQLSPARPSRRLNRRQQIILRRMGIRPESRPSAVRPAGDGGPTLVAPQLPKAPSETKKDLA